MGEEHSHANAHLFICMQYVSADAVFIAPMHQLPIVS